MTDSTNSDKDDWLLFQQQTKGIKRSKKPEKIANFIPKRVTKKQRDRENTQNLAHTHYDAMFAVDIPINDDLHAGLNNVSADESLYFARSGVQKKDITTLQKGLFKTHWECDLHGLTLDVAHEQIHTFLMEASFFKARYAIIIHGKGRHSQNKYPLLKNLVNNKLRKTKNVICFCSAQSNDGGTGAVYVLLKAKKENE